jgi:hypothetical protein
MKKIILLMPVFSLGMITGCSEQENVTAYEGKEIRIATNIKTVTRGNGVINSTYSSNLAVQLIRLDMAENSYEEEVPIDGTVSGNAMILTLNSDTPSENQYPANGNEVKLIGWYPNTGAFDCGISNGKVTFSIDGSTDIMATALTSGSLISRFPSGITFNHLLSQVRVYAYYENDNAALVWGGIDSIAFAGKAQTFIITLPPVNSPDGTAISDTQALGEGSSLGLKKVNLDLGTGNVINGDNENSEYGTGNVLTVGVEASNKTPLGYALFAPTTSSSLISIKTAKKEAEVTVSQHFAAETLYSIVLKLGDDLSLKVTTSASMIATWPNISPVPDVYVPFAVE